MKPLEKHLLILEPLLAELAPIGWFRKGRQLWHIDRQGGYALLIETEMFMSGTYKYVLVQYGSFWNGITAGTRGVSLGTMYVLDDSVLPFNTIHYESADELDSIVRRSAPILVEQLMQTIVPLLRTIHDLPSFVAVSQQLNALNHAAKWAQRKQVWDYFALGQPEEALAHLDRLIRPYPWREALEAHMRKFSPEKQDTMRDWYPRYIQDCEQAERKLCASLSAYRDEIAAIPAADLPRLLQERRAASESQLAAWIGPRRWNTLA